MLSSKDAYIAQFIRTHGITTQFTDGPLLDGILVVSRSNERCLCRKKYTDHKQGLQCEFGLTVCKKTKT